jgi:hypothetical protein
MITRFKSVNFAGASIGSNAAFPVANSNVITSNE